MCEQKKKEALLGQMEQEEEACVKQLLSARRECHDRLRCVQETLELVEQVFLVVWQCVAVRCRVLQGVAGCWCVRVQATVELVEQVFLAVLQCVAVCVSVWQCVAVC